MNPARVTADETVIAELDLVFEQGFFSARIDYPGAGRWTLGATDLDILFALPVDLFSLTSRLGPLVEANYNVRVIPLPASAWLLFTAVTMLLFRRNVARPRSPRRMAPRRAPFVSTPGGGRRP